MTKIRIAIINPILPHYRVPLMQALGEVYDLTFISFGAEVFDVRYNFKLLNLKQNKIGPFIIAESSLYNILRGFDIVISEGNLRYVDRLLVMICPWRKFKWINWGIGVSASYDRNFGSLTIANYLRTLLYRFADANIFYSSFPVKRYVSLGHIEESLFVAHNTVLVDHEYDEKSEKNSLLFIGTLYPQKGIYELLESYFSYVSMTENPLLLNIVGAGILLDDINKFITERELSKLVFLNGNITDNKVLGKIFSNTIAVISPKQAGLSVLSSFGYGVPFITRFDSITGGERLNIIHGKNGVLYSKSEELLEIINDIHNDKSKYIEMGKNAFCFYKEHRTVDLMVQQFHSAIQYTLKSKREF